MADLETNDGSTTMPETHNDEPVDLETGGNVPVDVENEQSTLDDGIPAVNFSSSDSTHQAANTTNDGRPSLTRGLHREQSRWGVSEAHLLRTSTAVSLSTGVEGGKETVVEEVTSHQEAMNPTERKFNQIFGIGTVTEDDEEALEAGTVTPKQYRLTARPSKQRRSCMEIITGTRDDCDDYDVTVGAKADLLTSYLRWTFRTSFTTLLLFSCACFMILSCAFAIAIHIVGIYQPVCISVGGLDYNAAGRHFNDAFALSWTTLSTVGYGHIYPNLAIAGGPRCLAVNFFCTLESFVGVLFASFMGAVMFGKIARVQSFAPTTFSDPIVVRYGTGLLPAVADDQSESSSVKSIDSSKQFPCPILEFRVVNRMHSAGGGEIMNCKLNVVANVLESEASDALIESVLHRSHQEKKNGMGKAGGIVTGTARRVSKVATGTAKQVGNVAGSAAKQVGEVTGTSKIMSDTAKQVGNLAGSVTSGVSSVAGTVASGVSTQAGKVSSLVWSPLDEIDEEKSYDPDEGFVKRREGSLVRSAHPRSIARESTRAALVDEGSSLAPRRIFSSLEVDTPAHPFFKRVWYVRHRLDEDSPLLSTKAKQMIIENDGFWPDELNNYKAIRENLHFHEIIVNLSGTANATGSMVYCQKVFSFVDVNIGYTFAKILLRRDDGKLGVDMSLINDVLEQKGGGGEPFTGVGGADFVGAAVGAAEKFATTAQTVAGRTQEQIVETTQNVAERTKQKVVQFKDMTVDSHKEVVGDSGSAKSPDVAPDGMQTGAKKNV